MSEVATPVPQAEDLFDAEEYAVPFPQIDGRERAELNLNIAGSIAFNRNEPEHAELFERLTMGRMVKLTVLAQVGSKRDIFKQNALGAESVTHTIGLRVHGVEPA